MTKVLLSISLVTVLFGGSQFLQAAGEVDVETQLREALRDVTLKLRDAQGQIATLQATEISNGESLKAVTNQVDKLGKELIAERNKSTNSITELNEKLNEKSAVITGLETQVANWKKSYEEKTAMAAKKEVLRSKFEAKSIKLERVVADQQVKNVQMYKVGMEILEKYEKFGLGEAVTAREPFVGVTRVKFQNLLQDYSDQLVDARIKPQ